MPRIRQESGREAPEEYGSEGNDLALENTNGGLLDGGLLNAQNAASTMFPNEDERLPLDPISDGVDGAGSIPPFKFLECDPLIPGEQPEPCPVCKENQYAYVPDYTILDDGDVFFDGKTCTQNLVITVRSPAKERDPGPDVTTLGSTSFIEEQKRAGILTLLSYFNKSNVATVYYYKKNEAASVGEKIGSVVGSVVGAVLGAASGPISSIASSVAGSTFAGEIPSPIKGYTLESEERDVVEELLPYTSYKFHIPIQRNARTRILISIPVEFLDRVPTRLITEPMADFETNLEVTINGDEFFAMIRRLTHTLRVYKNKYDRWSTLDGGQIIEKRDFNSIPPDPYASTLLDQITKVYLNLDVEASLIKNFATKVEQMIKEGAGLNFDDPVSYRGILQNKLEKVTFKFDLNESDLLELKQVIVNKKGCPNIIFSEDSQEEFGTGNLFKQYFVNTPTLQRPRTLFFIGALPDIDVDLNARNPKPWLDFVVSYTYPPVEVFYGSNPNTLLNDPNSLQCLAQAASQSDAPGADPGATFVGDILESAMGIGLGLPGLIASEFSKRSCKTPEEIKEEYTLISSKKSGKEYADKYKELLKAARESSKDKIQIQEPYLEMIINEIAGAISENKATNAAQTQEELSKQWNSNDPINKKEAKKQARKDKEGKVTLGLLWQRIFNKIKVCGFIDMTLSAADCIAKGLGQESATKALTKAAFDAMEDVHLERIFVGLPPEKQEEIFGVVRDNFENMPAPWDVGYIAGQYSGPGLNTKEIAARRDSIRNQAEQIEAAVREDRFFSNPETQERLDNLLIDSVLAEQERQQAFEATVGDGSPELFAESEEARIRSEEADRVYAQAVEEVIQSEIELQQQREREFRAEELRLIRQGEVENYRTAQPETNNSSTLNQNFDIRNFGDQSPGSGGTLGKALGNIQKEVFDAYRNAILDVVEADMLLEELNKLPGVPIVAGIVNQIKNSPCKLVDPLVEFNPRLDSFLNTLEADICDWDGSLTLPELDTGKFKENMLNLFRMASVALIEALKQAALAIAMEVLKKILTKILSIACDSLATLGANLNDLVDGSDHFRNLLRDNLCPDTSEEQFYDALKNIMDVATDSSQGTSCLERLTNAEIGDFIDDISLMLTQGQVIQLLTSSATPETITMALEVAATSESECIREIFSNPTNIIRFFASLGYFIPNLDELEEALNPGALDRNIYPCPDDIADILDDLRCDLFQQKGLSLDECRDRIDDLKDKAIQDLEDLADILQNGPFNNFPPLVSDPGCPPNGFLPAVDPLVADIQQSITEQMFQNIEQSHLRDLMSPIDLFTGRGGVLNAILADTRGRPWKFHNWLVGAFGSPLSQDLGVFEFYSDNSIKDPDKAKDAVDIYGNELKVGQGDFGVSVGGKSYGGYPPTVGAWMAKQLRDIKPKVKTVTIPEGFTSVTDALNEWQQVYEENQIRIERRLAYLEAFFAEFKFDEGGPTSTEWPQKYAIAKAEMKRAAREILFDSEDLTKRYTQFGDNSGENRTWRVLNGKDISIAGQVIGTKKLTKWDEENRNAAGTEGKDFVDYWGDESRLLPEPDTSAADITLKFVDFGDDPDNPGTKPMYQFDLKYDYNLFDEDGNLRQDNQYGVRLDVTYESANGGGQIKRSQKRKGAVEIPSSILDEGPYVYTKTEVISKGSIEADVEEYLNNLGIYDENVKDSYQIEAMYRFFLESISTAANQSTEVLDLLVGNPEVRRYFAKSSRRSSSAFDGISTGFLKRISQSIAYGRSDLPLNENEGTDSEPGFLEPPALSQEEQNKAEQKNNAKIALNVLSPGFRYGYDPYEEPIIEYLDPEKYGGLLVRNLIKIGADPASLPQPFYVKQQKFTGWMDLASRMVPEVDGCEPARQPLFKLDDIAENSSQLCSDLIPDERLQNDPLCAEESPYDKILEVGPSARIDGAIRAVIRIYLVDVFIRGTSSFVMFGMTNENYDDLLPAYVVSRIKEGLIEDGRLFNGRVSYTYYYRFLEQIYNTIRRKIDSNLIDPNTDFTEREKEAAEIIDREIQDFYINNTRKLPALSSAAISGQNFMKRFLSTPATKTAIGLGYGSPGFSKKKALAAKITAFNEMMDKTEEQALVFFERYVREEFESLKKIYQGNIPSSVDNVDYLFLLSDAWINGGVFGSGPFDVQSDPTNSEDYKITTGLPSSIQDRISELESLPEEMSGPLINILTNSFKDSNKDWPFVLERYIRIEEKEEPPTEISERPEKLYDIVNLSDWDEYVKSKKDEGLSGDISKFWGNPPPTGETTKIENHVHSYEIDEDGNGVTSSHVDSSGFEHYHDIVAGVIQRAELNTEDNGHRHEIEVTGWKFGLRLSYLVEKDKSGIFKEAMDRVDPRKIAREKTYRLTDSEGNERYIIPVASAELPIPDQEFNQFDPETYDVYCLIKELVKTVEYRTWFEYMFPLKRFTSLMAIYTIEGFFASLGASGWPADGGDMWEVAGGRKSIGPTFRKWARGENDVFTRSREDARDAFNVLYDTAASIDFKNENNHNHKNQSNRLRDTIRPKVNFEDGLRWWQRGRRINRSPFDQDGDECPDE